MIASHNVPQWFERQESTLPVAVTSGDFTLTRAAILGTVRNNLVDVITYGPKYRRAVADNLSRALYAFKREDVDAAMMWLGDAVKGATR